MPKQLKSQHSKPTAGSASPSSSADHDSSADLATENQQLRRQLKRLQERLAGQKQAVDQALAVEKAAWKSESQAWKAEYKQLQREKEQWQREKEQLLSQLKQQKRFNPDELPALRKQLESMRDEREDFRIKFGQTTFQRDCLEAKVKELNKALEKLNQDLMTRDETWRQREQTMNGRNFQLQNQVTALTQENQQLTTQIASQFKQAQLAMTGQQSLYIANLQGELLNLRTYADGLRQQLRQHSKTIGELSARLRRVHPPSSTSPVTHFSSVTTSQGNATDSTPATQQKSQQAEPWRRSP